jgi:hypothetical protein
MNLMTKLLMPWLLLVWLYYGEDKQHIRVLSVEFDNEGLCELARKKIQKEDTNEIHSVCLRYK